jgi:hypothetical protein
VNGRFIPKTAVTNVFVQEKRDGWCAAYPEATRNGDWDYACFLGDGRRNPNVKFDRCFSCHQGQSGKDFNLYVFPFVDRIKR